MYQVKLEDEKEKRREEKRKIIMASKEINYFLISEENISVFGWRLDFNGRISGC